MNSNLFVSNDYQHSSDMSITHKVVIVGGDEICGFYIAREILRNKQHGGSSSQVCVGYMCKDSPLIKELEKEGAELREFRLSDKESMKRLFEGMECAIITPPITGSNYQEAGNLIKCMSNAEGLKHVVLTSTMNADKLRDWERLKVLQNLEREFQSVMKKWEKAYIIRHSTPLESLYFIRRYIQEEHQLPWAIKDKEIAPVSLHDVAMGIIHLMKGKRGGGRENENTHNIMTFTGMERVDGNKLAEKCSHALGSRIELKKVSVDEFIKILKEQDELPKEHIELCREMIEAANKGLFSEQTNDLEKVLGKRPMSVEQYFQRNRNNFAPRK